MEADNLFATLLSICLEKQDIHGETCNKYFNSVKVNENGKYKVFNN
jgi:hypothetical protein